MWPLFYLLGFLSPEKATLAALSTGRTAAPPPPTVGSLLVNNGHALLGLSEAKASQTGVWVPCPSPCPTPTPARRRAEDLHPWRGLVKGTSLGRAPSVRHLLYLRKPSGLRSPHPTPSGHGFGEKAQSQEESFTEQRGRDMGALQ